MCERQLGYALIVKKTNYYMSWLKEDSKELYDQQIGYIISYTFSLMRPYLLTTKFGRILQQGLGHVACK